MRIVSILFVSLTSYIAAEEVLKVVARDSYLDAYQETKIAGQLQKADRKSDRFFPVYPGPVDPSQSQYGPPAPQYAPPAPQYGPPAPQYGPPGPQYGPPPSYGSFAEPTPQSGPYPAYGPPAQNLQVFYGVPHAMINVWDKVWEKIKWKLDLITFGKLLLKLVIFKKIVSFIAIIFLLLFIPALKHKKGFFAEENRHQRALKYNMQADDRLNELATFVTEAIQDYKTTDRNVPLTCDTKYCKTKKILEQIDKEIQYKKLVQAYRAEMKKQ